MRLPTGQPTHTRVQLSVARSVRPRKPACHQLACLPFCLLACLPALGPSTSDRPYDCLHRASRSTEHLPTLPTYKSQRPTTVQVEVPCLPLAFPAVSCFPSRAHQAHWLRAGPLPSDRLAHTRHGAIGWIGPRDAHPLLTSDRIQRSSFATTSCGGHDRPEDGHRKDGAGGWRTHASSKVKGRVAIEQSNRAWKHRPRAWAGLPGAICPERRNQSRGNGMGVWGLVSRRTQCRPRAPIASHSLHGYSPYCDHYLGT
ncbi:hypothetical protein F4780DRAFT_56381 [Xylariomycetidae sp. FL0641]|nr:hypothetical protein F4780DRAFT_56381 [Xylariomycetidae sp. FL0641]